MKQVLKLLCVIMVLKWRGISADDDDDDDDITTLYMENFCGEELSMILSSVHQFKLELNDRSIFEDGPCETQIEAWYSYPKIMFYFYDLDLDCNDGYLQFFSGRSGSTRVEGLERDICGDDSPGGIFTVPDMVMRVKYVPRRKQYLRELMSLIITPYSDEDECPFGSFRCDNSRCIYDKIRCTEYNPCGDKSDCRQTLTSAAIAGIVIGSLIALFFLVSIVVCCVCCRKRTVKSPGTVQSTNSQSVVYTTQQSGHNHSPQGIAPTNIQNPGYYSSGIAPSAPGVPYTNFTAGQQPLYPPNVSIPAYKPGINESPPAYAEIYGDMNHTEPVVDETAPVVYDNGKEKVAGTPNTGREENVYEPVGKPSDNHQYDNVKP